MGAEPPVYAHVPMILGDDGKRMSKRHGATSVMQYRAEGYLPEAVLNYLVRLGWSYGDQEIFTVDEMISLFDAQEINKAASTFNADKLLWINQEYIKNSSPEHIAHQLSWHLSRLDIDPSSGPDLVDVVIPQQERARTLVEMAENIAFFYKDFDAYDPAAAKKHLKVGILDAMHAIHDGLEHIDWEPSSIQAAIDHVLGKYELKLPKLALPMRVAIAGKAATPAIDVTLHLLGREKTLARLRTAIAFIRERAEKQVQKG
jgi:glutamyl-tRNA synthetase